MKRSLAFLITLVAFGQSSDDPLLKAMKDEVERSKTLQLQNLDKPYYIEYTVEDIRSFSVSASLGGILARNNARVRVPRTRVRVGDYLFDNGNYVYSDLFSGSRYDPGELSLDDNYNALRRALWLATDRTFKGAVEAIARKRAAMKNMTQAETLADFWKATPNVRVDPVQNVEIPMDQWTDRVRSLSTVFSAYPEVLASSVNFDSNNATFYLVNSEGTSLRLPDPITTIQIRAAGQASDGMNVRDAVVLPTLSAKNVGTDSQLRAAADQVAQRVRALAAAPVGETYNGPVLFEGVAGAQIIGEVLGPNLALPRRPVPEPGRPAPFLPSDFEGRIGSRVLPDFLDIIDDPTQESWNGIPLLGFYAVDYEGTKPAPLTLVEDGKLKTFLLSRQPVKGFDTSNGRARVPGSYGSNAAAISNLFVRSSESVKNEELRSRLLKMVQDRSKPYGIIIRKMDFPTTAPGEELRRIYMAASQSGASRPVSTPLAVYRVYPDGKEELVRGLRLRGMNVRALRDIIAVSEENYAFHYLNTLAPMSMSGGGYVSPTSVIAPSLLFDDLELERPQEDLPKLPVVPPPPLTAKR